jgi:hypothetical protein
VLEHVVAKNMDFTEEACRDALVAIDYVEVHAFSNLGSLL